MKTYRFTIETDVEVEYYDTIEVSTTKGIELEDRYEVVGVVEWEGMPVVGELIRVGDYGFHAEETRG